MIRRTIGYLRRHHVALIALVFAMGGTAYAGTQVGTKKIKDDSIRSVDVRDRVIRGVDVRGEAIKGRHIKNGSIGSEQLSDEAFPVSSAIVIEDGSGGVDLLDEDGFTKVEQTDVGTYELTFAAANPVCSIAATPFTSTSGNSYPPVTISGEGGEGQTLTLVTADANGDPANLGSDLGYVGFTVIGTC